MEIQLTTELTADYERDLVSRLRKLVDDRIRRETDIERQHADSSLAERQQYQDVFDALTSSYDLELQSLEESRTLQLSSITQRAQSTLTAVQEEFEQVLRDIDSRTETERESAIRERDESRWMLSSLLDGDTSDSPLARRQALESGMAASRTELELATRTLEGWTQASADFLRRCRILGETAAPDPVALPVDLAGLHQAGVDAFRAGEPVQRRIMRRVLPRFFRSFWPVLLFAVSAAVASGLVWAFVPPPLLGLKLQSTAPDWFWIAVGTGSAASLVGMFLLHLFAGQRVLPDYEQLEQLTINAQEALSRWTVVARNELGAQQEELARQHEARERNRERGIAHADERLAKRISAAEQCHERDRHAAMTVYPARLAELQHGKAEQLQQVEKASEAARHEILLRREHDFRQLQAEFDQRIGAIRARYQADWGQLIRDWKAGLTAIATASDALCDVARRHCPRWSTVLGGWLESRMQPVVDGGPALESVLSIGRVVVDLAEISGGLSTDPRLGAERSRFEFPVWLTPANRPSLVVRARGELRRRATDLLQTAMLRFLTTLPPGQVRFTIVDPVGLGANFASFMHLSDIDEQLVTSRIWTEPAHIEKRLADLTEHMETVLQTYLRNEYSSLDDYNREAGEVAEPYRIVTIANFPANFTEVALRRLVSIAQGGVKCGVFVLLSVDESLDLPRGFSLADLEQHAVVLGPPSETPATARENVLDVLEMSSTRVVGQNSRAGQERSPDLRLVDRVLGDWPLEFDSPPTAEEFGDLVRRAGNLARATRRVEVPFERVMPPKDGFWTSSSRSGLDIPMGRAGATKLQHLKLGKGTSQHVLIAGKTGSGKSSLLHALITNAALHYSPDEVEFYLIDFKKGVEFKAYATHRLPHARVIAIESDREFGVSVLQRLDVMLKERGELFRLAGVQDLTGFREARPETPMPRALLIIDEFQEFFVEDDVLSQSAALLLDRLVRQGRAFGIHVLLGSQTLAGAYSLARSTLGQIAVRIALQCSETDAHLILSEDNTAARLLSRPGEAIYNDANGLIEGNHHFQVVWLDDSQRETYLDWMQPWADEYQRRLGLTSVEEPRWPAAIVFEGNLPANVTLNVPFLSAVAQLAGPRRDTFDSVAQRRCWVGESVALTGAAELLFGPREGGPVLIVGRDEDLALGILSNMVIALAGQGPPPRFLILDGSLGDSVPARTWRALSRWIPTVSVVNPRDAAGALKELAESLPSRNESSAAPVFIVVFDQARFRDLRRSDDEFGGFEGFNKSREATPAQLFAEIVKEGSSSGVFPLVWCDAYATVQRFLGRDLLNRFETRILLPMNANDSSNLIDSPSAGRLGPNRALLYRADMGTVDKFRPYQAPSPGWIDEKMAEPIAADETVSPAPGDEHWTDIDQLNVL